MKAGITMCQTLTKIILMGTPRSPGHFGFSQNGSCPDSGKFIELYFAIADAQVLTGTDNCGKPEKVWVNV